MKKIFLLAFFFICYGLQAQNTLIIAECDTTDWDNMIPYLPVWGIQMTNAHHMQLLYLEADLAPVVGNEITKLTFHAENANVAWGGATGTVKLMPTTASALTTAQDVTDATEVYTGTFAVVNHRLVFTFETPYAYSGGNLLIDIETFPAGATQNVMFYGLYSGTKLGNRDGVGVSFYTKLIVEYVENIATYTITASAGDGGAISPNGVVSVLQNQDQRFDFIPNAHYALSKVLINNVENPQAVEDGFYIFTNVEDNHTISAEFTKIGGEIVVADDTKYNATVPFSTSYMDCAQHVQMLYLSEFIEGLTNKKITKITYHATKANDNFSGATGAVKIMMTPAMNLTEGFLDTTSAVQVYYGTLAVNNFLLEINFSTPFVYTGDNILIDFEVFPTGQSSYTMFYGGSSSELSRFSFTFQGSTFNETHKFTPKTTFDYEYTTQFTVSATAAPNGNITPKGEVAVVQGYGKIFTITPNPHYNRASVLVDGENNEEAVNTGTYEFTNVIKNHTIHAIFAPKIYTVTFMANGGTGAMEPQKFTYNEPQTLTANSFTRPNYEFKGWSTQEAGGGESYKDQQNITIDEDKTLFAQWTLGGIDQLEHHASLRIIPNPAHDYIELRMENEQLTINNVEIYDIYGRKQMSDIRLSDMRYPTSDIGKSEIGKSEIGKSEIGKSEIKINIAHLPAGLYFVKAANETVKLVVQ